ncbi:hypothetical protein ABZ805_17905 [Saccharopolyspora sp. NPDC047091]|uniref:hypothetical protein n=1 Tax=Saccharopolyspora sp. NPDC047091 TaxID=3155924 RepID=UPI00340CB8DF
MTVGVLIHWQFSVQSSTVDLFDHGDRLTEALLEQEVCTPELADSAVSVDRGRGLVEVEASAKADSVDEAIAVGQSAIRAALHACGVSTPFWPSHDDLLTLIPRKLATEEQAVS